MDHSVHRSGTVITFRSNRYRIGSRVGSSRAETSVRFDSVSKEDRFGLPDVPGEGAQVVIITKGRQASAGLGGRLLPRMRARDDVTPPPEEEEVKAQGGERVEEDVVSQGPHILNLMVLVYLPIPHDQDEGLAERVTRSGNWAMRRLSGP
jgi:hypothetical protein